MAGALQVRVNHAPDRIAMASELPVRTSLVDLASTRGIPKCLGSAFPVSLADVAHPSSA